MTSPVARAPAILAFGEVLWDVVGEREFIGGAPFNLAAHAAKCGLAAHLCSRVGSDDRGRRARDELRRLNVDSSLVQADPQRPTGWVDVRLRDGEPTYFIGENAAWDAIQPPAATARAAVAGAHFSALVCGTLAQRSDASRAALRELRALLRGVPVFYDVNLRPPHTPWSIVTETLPGVDVLKVNDAEARALSTEYFASDLAPARLFAALQAKFGLNALVVTRAAAGATFVSRHGVIDAPAPAVKVASAVGAGDAFAARFLAGWLRHEDPAELLRHANAVGAWVASRDETIPNYPAELQAARPHPVSSG